MSKESSQCILSFRALIVCNQVDICHTMGARGSNSEIPDFSLELSLNRKSIFLGPAGHVLGALLLECGEAATAKAVY